MSCLLYFTFTPRCDKTTPDRPKRALKRHNQLVSVYSSVRVTRLQEAARFPFPDRKTYNAIRSNLAIPRSRAIDTACVHGGGGGSKDACVYPRKRVRTEPLAPIQNDEFENTANFWIVRPIGATRCINQGR